MLTPVTLPVHLRGERRAEQTLGDPGNLRNASRETTNRTTE